MLGALCGNYGTDIVEPLRARPRGKYLGSEGTAFLVRVWKIRRSAETQIADAWLMRYQRKQRLYWEVRKRPYCWYCKTKQNNNKKKKKELGYILPLS